MSASKKSQGDLLAPPYRGFTTPEAWSAWLHEVLPRPFPEPLAPLVVDLFAGCGGLSLGFECKGMRTVGWEMKPPAVDTYNTNLAGGCHEATLEVGDPEDTGERVDILVGGPPCQPFSQIGYQRGHRDHRDGFPIFLDAVQRLRPKVAIIENVRGLLYRNKDYLRQAVAELNRFGYQVDARLMDTSAYGVPQRRERVVVVAHHGGWQWPEPVVSEPVTAGVALGSLADEVTDTAPLNC